MKNRLFFTILALILISAMIPPVVKTKKNAAKANGIYSAKRLGITMNEFDAVNDHYPLPYGLKATPSPQKIKWGSRAVVLLSLVLLIFLVSRWICAPLKRLQPTPDPHPHP
ncbi:MAG: hypothetical protein OSA93_02345 [Akkermansiaceae bacterium]|jgi:hypothetical protein|nr:hypothetical protein [Akkermansiaceae bacterium]